MGGIESAFPGFTVERKDDRQLALLGDPDEVLESVRVYRSGASNPAEFNAYAACGEPAGVVVGLLSAPMRERLRQYVGEGGQVFIDSGVYSSGAEKTVDFNTVMAQYAAIAAAVEAPSALLLVMPDRPGDYDGTLKLLRQHREAIASLRATGAEVMVPLQRGGPSIVSVYDEVRAAVGFEDFCVGLPCKMHCWPPDAIRHLMRERAPARVHLLGVGADRRKLYHLVERIATAAPATRISADSCRIRAMVGEGAPVTVATRAIRAQTQRQLGDLAPLLAHLWCDPTELARTAWRFGQRFGYGEDETEIVGELGNPGAFPLEELAWLAEQLTCGARTQEVRAIAQYWAEHGLIFDEMHEMAEALQRQFAQARQSAIEMVTTIEQSGGRLRRSRASMPLAA